MPTAAATATRAATKRAGGHGPSRTANGVASRAAAASVPRRGERDGARLVDGFALAALALAALATRWYRILLPPEIIFDEVHFGKFTVHYLRREFFFDIHPPLGKLTFAAVARAVSLDPQLRVDVFDEASVPYPSDVAYGALRITSALFGAAIVPLAYWTCRAALGVSVPMALVAAALLAFEPLNVVQCRQILVDAQLLLYAALSLHLAMQLLFVESETSAGEWDAGSGRGRPARRGAPPTEAEAAGASRATQRTWWRCILLGLACGASLSVKWTVLGIAGMIGGTALFGSGVAASPAPHRRKRGEHPPLPPDAHAPPLSLLHCALVAASALALYTAAFAVHFATLTRDGPGDPFMPRDFRRRGFLANFAALNWRMFDSNRGLTTPHPWDTRWHEWPRNARGLLFWSGDAQRAGYMRPVSSPSSPSRTDGGMPARVYAIGSPLTVWLSTAGVAASTLLALLARRYPSASTRLRTCTDARIRFLLGCYLCSLLPYALVQRTSFVYHYMPPMYCAVLLTAALLDRAALALRAGGARIALAGALLIASCCTYLYFAPWVYAIPLPWQQHEAMQWLPRWT